MEQLIPKLRFPEFSEEWEKKRLGELGTFKGGGTPKTSNDDFWKGSIPWVSSSDISEDNHQVIISRYITEEAIKKSATQIVNKGTLLVVSRVGVGKFAIAPTELCTSQDFINFNVDTNTSNSFVAFSFKKNKNILHKISQGTSIKGFTTVDFKNIKITIPSLPEQQKIADYLSTIDKKLELLRKKREQLECYKKGMMQQLFSQQIRFKDDSGKDYPDWQEKKLGEIGDTYGGLTGKNKMHFGIGEAYYITYKQIFDMANINLMGCEKVSVDSREKQNEVEIGDVLFTISSETPHEVGMSSVILERPQSKTYLNSFSFGFRRFEEEVLNPLFSKYIFRNSSFRKIILPLAQGSTRYNISKKEVLKLKINLPSLPEQQKIAEFLSALDTKIEGVANQIEQTEAFKKAMLQQLFV